jgi:hypothetical protein
MPRDFGINSVVIASAGEMMFMSWNKTVQETTLMQKLCLILMMNHCYFDDDAVMIMVVVNDVYHLLALLPVPRQQMVAC